MAIFTGSAEKATVFLTAIYFSFLVPFYFLEILLWSFYSIRRFYSTGAYREAN